MHLVPNSMHYDNFSCIHDDNTIRYVLRSAELYDIDIIPLGSSRFENTPLLIHLLWALKKINRPYGGVQCINSLKLICAAYQASTPTICLYLTSVSISIQNTVYSSSFTIKHVNTSQTQG